MLVRAVVVKDLAVELGSGMDAAGRKLVCNSEGAVCGEETHATLE